MFGRLLFLFIGVPLAELFLFLQLGSKIGLPATFVIILVTGALGAWLTKVQGLRALTRFQQAAAEGRVPHEEVLEGLMILVAGAVLLTPGFLTDAVGFLLLVPQVRAVVRHYAAAHLKDRVKVSASATMDAINPIGRVQQGGERVVEAKVIGDE